MTTKDRVLRMISHQEADRIPIIDHPWAGTVKRWEREGMPVGMDWRDYFGVDRCEVIGVDITPRYPQNVIEETEQYRIVTTPWGVTLKEFKELDSTPEFLDFKVNTPEAWEDAKGRMSPDRSRINWKHLEQNYGRWVENGSWIEAGFWFGFDVTHSWMAGTETILIALLESPEWVMDMIDTYLNMCIAHFDMIWDAGYRFDGITWPDDMGYKNTPFFSTETYKNIIKPFHKKAVKWAHDKGIAARLHSCGDIMPLLPEVADTGIDILNPLEIKAGMDPFRLKKEYGDKLTFHGGINAQLWDDADKVVAEIEKYVPTLMENGGYIFASDHSIPNCTSLETMKKIVETAKQIGTYK